MGGPGSGRWSSATLTCEGANSIDLAWLRRRGILRTGNRTTLRWSVAEAETGSIGVLVEADGLRLMYAFAAHDSTKVSVNERVPFVHTVTKFGGRRKWLMCIGCGRGSRRLFMRGGYFRCRQCHGLKYASQSESPAQRAMHRADRIANRLHDMWKGTTKAEWDFPPKPPRMRWATYQRLLNQYDDLQNKWAAGIMARFTSRRD